MHKRIASSSKVFGEDGQKKMRPPPRPQGSSNAHCEQVSNQHQPWTVSRLRRGVVLAGMQLLAVVITKGSEIIRWRWESTLIGPADPSILAGQIPIEFPSLDQIMKSTDFPPNNSPEQRGIVRTSRTSTVLFEGGQC